MADRTEVERVFPSFGRLTFAPLPRQTPGLRRPRASSRSHRPRLICPLLISTRGMRRRIERRRAPGRARRRRETTSLRHRDPFDHAREAGAVVSIHANDVHRRSSTVRLPTTPAACDGPVSDRLQIAQMLGARGPTRGPMACGKEGEGCECGPGAGGSCHRRWRILIEVRSVQRPNRWQSWPERSAAG